MLPGELTDYERLWRRHVALVADAQIAHHWFARHFGADLMNGRDFAVKCAEADRIMAEMHGKLDETLRLLKEYL